MFGIGLGEFILIIIAALIAIGPEKLPAVARAIGKVAGDLKKAGDEVKKSIREASVEKDGGGPPEKEG